MRHRIEIIGLGAGDLDQLTLGMYKKLTGQDTPLYVRTAGHPVMKQLEKEGVTFTPFDHIYETTDQFGNVYRQITDTLLEKAQNSSIVYAVPGHPMLAEKTVQLLLEQDEDRKSVV